MRKAEVYINGFPAKEKWGIIFTEEALTALMTPAAKKEYIKNECAIADGEELLSVGEYVPKTAARDIQLMLGMKAKSLADFLINYRSFVAELGKGALDIVLNVWDDNTYFNETYHTVYMSCSQYSEFNGRLAKFLLKLREPNPNKREFESNVI